MDLETLVRETLAEHAADAPSADGLLNRVTARRRRLSPWLAAGLSAAAVVALAVGLSLHHDAAGPVKTAAHGGGPPPETSTPAGYKRISYRGASIAVPSDLPVYTTPCLLPARYVLAADPNVEVSCVAGNERKQTLSVTLTTASAVGLAVPGERTYPELGIAVYVDAPDQSTIDHILDSVRAGTDPLGCPARLTTVHNPAADALVPPMPDSAVRCVYSTSSDLQASYSVDATALPELVAAINALPGSPPFNDATGSSPVERDLLRFGYPSDASRTLEIRLSGWTEYTDGHRSGYDHDNVVTDELRTATAP